MINGLISLFLPGFPTAVVYMLQSTEYQIGPYLNWFWHTKNFSKVMQRRTLDQTRSAKLLLIVLRLGIMLQIVIGLSLVYLGLFHGLIGGVAFGFSVIIISPILWAHLIVIPLVLGRIFISVPANKRQIMASEAIFRNHPAIKIAVVGSYGKTTMKELLATVLKTGFKVAETPANKNVSVSHAQFAKKLVGDEQLLIIEYGEGAPGDVAKFAQITHPNRAIITGLAPAHLDQYKTLKAAGHDIFSVAEYVPADKLYVNVDSPSVKPFIQPEYQQFSEQGSLGWQTSSIKVDLNGTAFSLKRDKQIMRLHSGLVGKHQVGFLAMVAALGFDLGLSIDQIEAGIAQTKPFEHRMQPYQLSGAWVVDDTYNGNLEGIKAGTQLLNEISAKRKIYVTPGLVDQGEETEKVHLEVGRLIAKAQPDIVVLMKNSVTNYIQLGLETDGFKGELRIEDQPLEFYTNLKHFVASGDLVVMQNDWTDNYA